MNVIEIAKSITDEIVNFDNNKKLNWKEVYEKEFDSLKNLTDKEKDLILIQVVKDITRRGYSIEDNQFKLTRF